MLLNMTRRRSQPSLRDAPKRHRKLKICVSDLDFNLIFRTITH